MSGKTYSYRELIQWGYIAFISIALAFTTITVASASTRTNDYFQVPESDPLDACMLSAEGPHSYRRLACDSGTQTSAIENFQAAIRSAFKIDRRSALQTTYPASNVLPRYAE